MRSPLKIYKILFLLILFSACTKGGEDEVGLPAAEALPGTPEFYLDRAIAADGAGEKIRFLNEGLKAVEHRSDTILPDLLDFKIYYHNTLKEYDSSFYFADSLINVAGFQQDTISMANGFYRRSKINFYLDRQEEVFRDAFESRRLYLIAGDTVEAGRLSLEMANAQTRTGDHTGSRESATEALRFLGPTGDSTYIVSSHIVIAISYRTQGFPEDAIPEYENALEYSNSGQQRLGIINNIALAYQELEEYDKAINILEELVEESQDVQPHLRARYVDNLAYTKWLRDPGAPVEEELLEAMQAREAAGDTEGLLASYAHLTEFYSEGNKPRATTYAGKLLENARSYGNSKGELQALKYLLELNPQGAEDAYALEYVKISDSLGDAALKAKNTFAKIRFDEERKQQEIFGLQARNAQQALETQRMRTRSYSAVLLSLLLILGFSFLIYFLRQRHKREKVKEVYKTESRISKLIHDELANDIYNVMSVMETVAPVPVLDRLESIYRRTRDISRQNREINTGEDFVDHLVSILSNNTPAGTKLILRGEKTVSWKKLSDEKKLVIYRVLQELMINVKKHSGASFVAVTFAESGKFLEINFTDNGCGTNLNNSLKSSGLLNVQNRMASINGKISFESEKGKGFKAFQKVPL